MSVFGNIGNAIKKGVVDTGHFVGKVADNKYTKAALAAGLASTGVGIPASAAIMAGTGILGGALHPGGGLHDAAVGGVEGGATGAAAGALGSTNAGQGFMGKLGSIAQNVGGQAKDQLAGTFAPGGKIDFGKVIGTGGAIADMIGKRQSRKNAENYANSQIDQRNQLMSRILAPQNYGVPQITPAQNSGGY